MTNMDCKTCKDLLWAYCVDDLGSDRMRQVDEHTANCPSCRQELTATVTTTRFLHTHMPVLQPDNAFAQATLDKITLTEPVAFLKLMAGIMLVLTFILLTGLLIISPLFISLLWVAGNILLTLVQQGAFVLKTAPLLQIISGTILTALLIIVLASIRHLAMRRIA